MSVKTEAKNCPTCGSHDVKLHPAMQVAGEVQLCRDPWHSPTAEEIQASERKATEATKDAPKSDIVEKLRVLAGLVDESQQRNTATGNVSREAADEIEFLRTALAQSEQRTELWKAQCQRDQTKLRELGVLPTA